MKKVEQNRTSISWLWLHRHWRYQSINFASMNKDKIKLIAFVIGICTAMLLMKYYLWKLELIEQIYKDPKFIKACRQITGGSELADDLLQHCAIKIHEKKIDSKSITSPIQFFKAVAWREWNTKSSKFNQQYGHKDRVPLIGHTNAIVPKDEPNFIDWLNAYLSEPKKNKALKFQNEIFLL